MADKKSTAERFWTKVDVRGPDECWKWLACRRRKSEGYGAFGRNQVAHRVAWELTNGVIPDGMLVLHRCDNPPCVNPAHLFLGSQYDNIHDCFAKGRANRAAGARHWGAKLTEEAVRDIRASTEANPILARQYSVSAPSISMIRNRRTWRHVD